jgi:hypothetical protein
MLIFVLHRCNSDHIVLLGVAIRRDCARVRRRRECRQRLSQTQRNRRMLHLLLMTTMIMVSVCMLGCTKGRRRIGSSLVRQEDDLGVVCVSLCFGNTEL